MEKSTALLILGLNEDNLTKENIDKAYNDTLGQFSEELLNEAKNCLLKELRFDNEQDMKEEISKLTETIDAIKNQIDEISDKLVIIKNNYDMLKKDEENIKSIYIDKNTRREQIASYISLLNQTADTLLNQIMLPETPKNEFDKLKTKRNTILTSIKRYENEYNALNYIIERENKGDFPEKLNIVSEIKVLDETKEQENNIEPSIDNNEYFTNNINNEFPVDNDAFMNSKDDMHEVFPQDEQINNNADYTWTFNQEPQIDTSANNINNIDNNINYEQPVDDQEVETKGDYTWTFNQEQVEQPQEMYKGTDIPNDINDYTYEEGPVEDKPTVLQSTGYIITKSYQKNIKLDKEYYNLQKDNYKVKTKPFGFISKLKDKIEKARMNKRITGIIAILKEKSAELYKDYLKIEKIKEVINSLGEGSIQRQAYENLIETIYTGKQNKVDYIEYVASSLDEFTNTNPNIKEDTQRMIAYELSTELNDFNVDDAIVENTYQGQLDNPNYTNDVVAFDEWVKNVNSIKRINTEEQQKTL